MLQPGTILQQRYEVVRLIARGGMGAVYEATDRRLGKRVALKQTLVTDPQLRAAFEHEARLLANLDHAALPHVSDHFLEGADQFLVMQYIDGDDLARLLEARGGPFPVAEVLHWADTLLDALDYLHSRTPPVIHRDIKPLNLKLTGRGGVMLLDFGLAKGAHTTTPGYAPASIFGYTPQYAPIEQIQGSGTDARSDIYSLAATLYQLLTGQAPPDALSRAAATVAGQADPLQPAHMLNPQLSQPVAEVLLQAMAQHAAARFASAAAMRQALHDAAKGRRPGFTGSSGKTTLVMPTTPPTQLAQAGATAQVASLQQPVTATTVSTRPRHSFALLPALAGLGILLVVLLFGFLFMQQPGSPPPATALAGVSGQPASEQATAVRSTPANEPTEGGLSRSDPLPPGVPALVPGWQVQLLETVRGQEAWNRLYETNQFNKPAPEGQEYLLLKLRLRATFEDDNQRQFYPRLTGALLRDYLPASAVPPTPKLETELGPGEEAEGWISYLVGVGEERLMLKTGDLSSDSDREPRFIALAAGTAITVDPNLRTITPTDAGRTLVAPLPLGETATSEDWQISIREVVRGEEALKIIQQAASNNDPPPQGSEYLLVKISLRSIATTDDVRMISRTNFKTNRSGTADSRATELNAPVVINIMPEMQVYLYPGGEFAGWIPLLVPIGANDVVVVFRPGFIDDLNIRYLALE